MTGTLRGLGVGPGDPELITLKAVRLLRAAPVVAYPLPEAGESLARAIAAPYLAAGRREIPIPIPIGTGGAPLEAAYDRGAEAVAGELEAGRDVVFLCEGDPLFYGSFVYLSERLAGRFPVETVPGVTSVAACAAALGAALAVRDEVFVVLPATLDAARLAAKLGGADAAAILKVGRHFAKVRGVLERAGLAGRARYVEHATLPAERVLALDKVDPAAVPYFSMVLVGGRRGGTT